MWLWLCCALTAGAGARGERCLTIKGWQDASKHRRNQRTVQNSRLCSSRPPPHAGGQVVKALKRTFCRECKYGSGKVLAAVVIVMMVLSAADVWRTNKVYFGDAIDCRSVCVCIFFALLFFFFFEKLACTVHVPAFSR